MNVASYDWLISARSYRDLKNINDILNATAIRFDQNMIVSYPKGKRQLAGLCDDNFKYNNENRSENKYNVRRQKNYSNRNCRFENRYDLNCSYGQGHSRSDETKYYKTSPRFHNLAKNKKFVKSGTEYSLSYTGITNYNYSRKFEMINASSFTLGDRSFRRWTKINKELDDTESGVYLVQYFKVRENSTLYAYLLGTFRIYFSCT